MKRNHILTYLTHQRVKHQTIVSRREIHFALQLMVAEGLAFVQQKLKPVPNHR